MSVKCLLDWPQISKAKQSFRGKTNISLPNTDKTLHNPVLDFKHKRFDDDARTSSSVF